MNLDIISRRLYLYWTNPKSHGTYKVGVLEKTYKYTFHYGWDIDKALEDGFKLILPFDKIDKVYKSDFLFGVFASRLPDKKRRDIDRILKRNNILMYDEFDLLEATAGKLPIDSLSVRSQ